MAVVADIIPQIVLNSGHKMPVIGMGCAVIPAPPLDQLISAFIDAIEVGYRHFDTAASYGSEEALGIAIAKAIEVGFIKSRDELFITSKLWMSDADPDLVLPAITETLRKLGLDYVDLYLVHFPLRLKPTAVDLLKLSNEDVLPSFDMHGTWKAMEECNKLGLAKSIGVSNFSCQKLSQLLQYTSIPPAINQVEMNVSWQQRKLMTFCKEKNIHVSAWSPLGAYGLSWGTNSVMESSVLKDIAASESKTVAQVALRWVYEQGAVIIVRSLNKERMKQNLQIFDWELTDEERDQIQQIPQSRGYRGEVFVHPNGPYKSIEELWDGEI